MDKTGYESISEIRSAGDQEAGLRLDRAAAMLFPEFSRGRLQKWIKGGQLKVDGVDRKPTFRLSGGEKLSLRAEWVAEGFVRPQELPLDVLFVDDDLLVINKPTGLVVHPAAGNPDGTLQNALLFHYPELEGIPRAGIVHRLDKDTTGVMVVARSLRAHTSLVQQLQSRTMSRRYRAVASGVTPLAGTVDEPIGRHPRDRVRMAVIKGGKPAVTHYRRLDHSEHFSDLEVALETGRTHQIRVHMTHLGYPLVGDAVYGQASELIDRQALHAWKLRLQHPSAGQDCHFEAILPADLVALQERVGLR